jgi:hypothetical protein
MKTKIYVEELTPINEALPLITDEWIAEGLHCDMTVISMRDALTEASAKMSERKTVHEWLNAQGIPAEEGGVPLCLLRRLRIALDYITALRDSLRRETLMRHIEKHEHLGCGSDFEKCPNIQCRENSMLMDFRYTMNEKPLSCPYCGHK